MVESKPFILVLLLASTASSMTLLELEEELEDFVHYQPQQTHLSVNGTNLSKKIQLKIIREIHAEDGTAMTVTWVTWNDTMSYVEYSDKNPLKLDKTALGHSVKFVDGGPEKREMWIHRVTIENLKANSTYCMVQMCVFFEKVLQFFIFT